MATTINAPIKHASLFTLPSHIWVGDPDSVRAHIITLLQQQLCSEHGCAACSTCHAIATEQHYAIQWIRPEKQYTRELLEPVFEQLSFSVNGNEQFFFILENVDFMPAVCANSLLKSLEEPPPGYFFFLIAQREHTILPTIRSRCMIHFITAKREKKPNHILFDYFTTITTDDPLSFLTHLEKSEINEQESIALLDSLLAYWMRAVKKALHENNTDAYQYATRVVACLSDAFEKLPMPGSSKLFWKNMYVQIKNISL